MKFAERIFERATIKGVADYLLYGMVPDKDDRSYETRLEDADLIYEKVAKQYGEDGASVLLSAASELVNENASVYGTGIAGRNFVIRRSVPKHLLGKESSCKQHRFQ